MKPSWIRVTLKSNHQTYFVKATAAFQDHFKPVCSCMPSYCLLQKQPSNHSKKLAFPRNKIHYTLLWKSPIRPNINLNSIANLWETTKYTFPRKSSNVLLMHTWCMQFCLIEDTYQGRAKNVWSIEWKTVILLPYLGLPSNWLQVKVTKFYCSEPHSGKAIKYTYSNWWLPLIPSNWLQVKVTKFYCSEPHSRKAIKYTYSNWWLPLKMTLSQFAVSYWATVLFRSSHWINQMNIFLYL